MYTVNKEDVKVVAKSIDVTLTDSEIQEVIDIYPSVAEQDPTGLWYQVIEQAINEWVENNI